MEKLISMNVDIKVNNKEKLKLIVKVLLFAAASIAAFFGVLGIRLFYNSGIPLYLLMFALAFCASAAVRAAVRRNVAAALCGIPIGVFAAIYQVNDILSRGSNRFDRLIFPCVAAAAVCVSAAAVNAIVSGLLIKGGKQN